MSSHILLLVIMILYLIFMLMIGISFSKKNESAGDFYLGGRKLGPFVTAMSAEASDMSSWLLMGLPGVAYLTGVADAAWTAIGLAVGTYLNWLIVAKRIRHYSHHLNAITIPEFFSKRYKDDKNILTLVSSIIIIVFFIPYVASGFAACGKLFQSLFDVQYHVAMLISAAVIITYCTLGGFLAASTTDLIQSIVMSIALIVVVCFGISSAKGLNSVMDTAKALPGYLSLTKTFNTGTQTTGSYGFITICSTLAWGLGYFGMPHILLRFMAIKEAKKLTLSRRIATVWVVISLSVAIFIGIIGYAMTHVDAIANLSESSSTAETVIIKIADLLSSHGVVATIIAGLILAGILAATMSTADSQLLAAASSVSQNIAQDVLHIKISAKASVLVARISVVIIAIIGVFIASDQNSSVFEIVSFAWAGFGATFGPVVLLALFWKRSNKQGALASMLVGGIMIFVWKYAIRPLGGALDIYELLPAFLLALAANVIVSLCTKAPEQEVIDTFQIVCKNQAQLR